MTDVSELDLSAIEQRSSGPTATLLKSLFQKYSYFSFSALVAIVVYAGLGYLVMTKDKD